MLKLYQYIYGAQVFWGHVSTFPLPLSIMIGSQNQKQEILENVAQGHPSYIYNYMDSLHSILPFILYSKPDASHLFFTLLLSLVIPNTKYIYNYIKAIRFKKYNTICSFVYFNYVLYLCNI